MKISKKFFDILSLLCPFYDDFIVFRTHNKFLIPIPMAPAFPISAIRRHLLFPLLLTTLRGQYGSIQKSN